ncbi:MAG: ABC transporter ATP-binding protein [Elusimicrobia bacterium]|nr:ABC transporter ATP-binding protein [Candidatus Obscuribacterium magneticum]
MRNGNISILIHNLQKKMGHIPAIKGMELEFGKGQLHGLIGPEGAGKTTLLRILMGLLRPDAGEIIFLENNKKIEFSEIRPDMAYMPQQQSLYPDLSCAEHLDFFRDLYQIPNETYRERRKTLLHITRLDKFVDRKAGQLSGGMYKKLGLMCALLQSPRILLLDEPTNGVDPISRREFWDLLYQFWKQGVLIIMTTAYMDEAERCSSIHLFDSGRLLVSGEPRKILEQEKASSFDEIFIKRSEVL